jgi:hypothetical protein
MHFNQTTNIMRHTYLILLIALVIGCAERNVPVQVSNNDTFKLISQTETPGWAKDVWIEGTTAYIADDEVGVSVFDVTSIDSPKFVASFPLWGIHDKARAVQYANNDGHKLLLVVGQSGGLNYYDPDTYEYIGNFGSGGISDLFVIEVATDSLHIGIADYIGDGFGIRKMGWGWDPFLEYYRWISTYKFLSPRVSSYRGVFVDDTTAYLAHGQAGFDIVTVDYTFPDSTIKLQGNLGTPGNAYDVTMNRDRTHAIVADYQGGILIVDVNDSSAPAIVASLLPDRVDQVVKVEAAGDTIYFIDQHNAIFAADISVPSDPILLGSYKTPEPTSIFIGEDQTIYLTDDDLGFIILQWQQ